MEKNVIIAYFDDWKINVVGRQGDVPIRPKHIVRYLFYYLKYGRGSFRNRLTSVLTRLFTSSLKPSLVSVSNCGEIKAPLENKVTR